MKKREGPNYQRKGRDGKGGKGGKQLNISFSEEKWKLKEEEN